MNLNQLGLTLWGRRWMVLITLAVTVGVAAIITLRMPAMYVATTSVIISFEDIVPYENVDARVQLSGSYMITQVNIIQSRTVALRVVDTLKLADMPEFQNSFLLATEGKGKIEDWLAGWLIARLTVQPSRSSRVVDISFTANDPGFAASVANAFAQAYIETKLDLAVEPARQTSVWLAGQLAPLRAKVEAAQAKLTAYQQANAVIAVDDRLDIETLRLQSLSAELLTAQNDSQNAENREKQLEDLKARGLSLETLPEIANNGFIQSIKAEMLRKDNELAELGLQVGENHPQYRRVQGEVRNLRRKLQNEIAIFTRGIRDKAELARNREATLEASLAAQKQKVLELKRQHDGIAVLMREVDGAQRAYDDALTRFDKVDMESRVVQTNALLFNRATAPLDPATPKVKQNLIIALFAGTLLGLGLALLMESLSPRARSGQDVARYLGTPVLGTLGDA